MTDLINWLLILVPLILGVLALNGQWLVAAALVPRFVERCRDAYARPVRATLVGLLVWAPCVVLAMGLKVTPPVILLLTIMSLLAASGSAGLALRIGSGLDDSSDADRAWKRVQRGGRVLSLSLLLPLVGWFVLFPWLVVSGTGAAVMGLIGRRAADQA